MKFSDMLKNKKKNQEQEVMNENNEAKSEIEQELEQVSEILSHQGDGGNSENIPASDVEDQQASQEDKLKTDLTEANNKYLRLYAEFDNYKRRTNKERIELLQTAGKDVLSSLLPVVDDFDRALKSMETASDVSAVKEGIVLVQNKLKSILTQKGLKEMESVGTVFDPELHEAITNIPAPSNDLKGKVIDEVEKGYYLHDKVIRFAKVVVGA
ncbi:nucleotide exchange factor GrpE [Pedobacter superstes]|uniref:nucleotide exchange factor GrpE n=1 Tax=Pedobacter superstes TaxID=3133441 RepID=UPI003D748F03